MNRVYHRTMSVLTAVGGTIVFSSLILINHYLIIILTGGTIAITSTILNDEKHYDYFKKLFKKRKKRK